jgi:hypothetical protein
MFQNFDGPINILNFNIKNINIQSIHFDPGVQLQIEA